MNATVSTPAQSDNYSMVEMPHSPKDLHPDTQAFLASFTKGSNIDLALASFKPGAHITDFQNTTGPNGSASNVTADFSAVSTGINV